LEKIEIILTDCIKEIRSGKTTLAECLGRYPSLRRELEPLLRMALNIDEPPAFSLDPAYKQSARAQLLQRIRTAKPVKPSRSWANIFNFGLPPQLVWARAAVAVVIGIIIVSLLGGGTAYAAQSSLPGEILYPVKTGTEEFRLWMARDTTDKAELNMAFAQTRLVELNQLAAKNSSQAELAVQGYRSNLWAAEGNLQSITDAAIRANTLERFLQKVRDQISYSDVLVDATNGENLSIRQAADLAIAQQIDTLTNLAQQDNLLAARGNLDMMQNRLQRAQAKAIEQQYQIMQAVLEQYQQFNELGQRILLTAHNTQNQTAEIDNLTDTRLQSYLETLDTISQQVPQGYQNEIEASQTMTTQYQNQARYGYQAPDESSGESGQTPGFGPGPGPNITPSNDGSDSTLEPGPSTVSPSPIPGNGGGAGGSGGSGTGSEAEAGGGSTSQPNTGPNTGGNTSTGEEGGSGTGSGGDTGTGGGTNANSGNTSGSTGGSSKR
jgi:hypothetical protein